MKLNAWVIFLVMLALLTGIAGAVGWGLWAGFSTEERTLVAKLWASYAGLPLLAGFMLVLLLGLAVNLVFRWYIEPLHTLAEEIRIIAMSNPRHRVDPAGKPALREFVTSLNLLAERYQDLGESTEARISQANAALEEEKNTLAALMSKLTQGVLVCNREGKILLYNQYARGLLEGSVQQREGGAGLIGIGRSIYGVLPKALVSHALRHAQHRFEQGELGLMAPFVASGPGGQLLSVHLVPILDKDKSLTGYILTLEDITRRTETESRRGLLLQELTEGQRSSIAGIRAAIETLLDYPDMDEEHHRQFQQIIRDESLKLSQHLDSLLAEYSEDLRFQWPLEEMLGSDLLMVIERRLNDTFDVEVGMSGPREVLWLRVDSYALVEAMVFIVGQLIAGHRAERIELKLEREDLFACLEILWQGVSLDMETLRAWGQKTLVADDQGAKLTLQGVIDHHAGALWTQTNPESGYCHVSLLLPVVTAPGAEHPAASASETAQSHDYDFNLFRRREQPSEFDDRLLPDLSYTVMDTETTGLNPAEGDEIIAIGGVRIVNARILEREIFECFIDPRRAISEASIAIHGISPKMLRGMPTIDEVLPKFHRFVEDTVIIGHNIAFDMRFLELKEASTSIKFTNHVLDTLLLACVVNPNHAGQNLESLAQRLGIAVTGRHTALGDAITTAQVFLALIPLLAERGIRTLRQASAACKKTEYARLKY